MTSRRVAHAAAIARWRENLIDLDVVVDDKRRLVEDALDELRVALRERNRAARHLAHLVDWAACTAVPQREVWLS